MHDGQGLHSDPGRARIWSLVIVGIVLLVASVLPAAMAGAKTGVGSFRLACGPASHTGTFDPIVSPGQSPAGHQHEFYGSTATGPSSTPGSLIGSSTTCSDSADSSAYWHPTVFFNGGRAPVTHSTFYYTQRTTKKPLTDLQVWPAGLRVIAGDARAQSPQDITHVWWDCDGVEMEHQPTAPTCPTNARGLEANIRFPDCWDGANLDSADHKSHMSYSVNDGGVYRCDAAHPVSLPFIHMIFRWDGQYPLGDTVTLSSGSSLTFHADFMNGWNQQRLQSLVDQCIKTSTECGRITDSSQPNFAFAATSPSTTVATTTPSTTVTTATPATRTATINNSTTGATMKAYVPSTNETTAVESASASTGERSASTARTQTGITTGAVDPSTRTVPIASGPVSLDVNSGEGRAANVGAVAVVFAFVIVGGGLWALAALGYSWLRRLAASPGD